MKKIIFLLLIVSCSFTGEMDGLSEKDLTEREGAVGFDMMGLNSRMRAALIGKEKYKDFNGFTSDVYLRKMSQYKIPSDTEYIEYMSAKDIQIVLIGKDMKFTICTKSVEVHLVFCDDAYTEELEFHSTDINIDLNEKIKEYI